MQFAVFRLHFHTNLAVTNGFNSMQFEKMMVSAVLLQKVEEEKAQLYFGLMKAELFKKK